MNHGRSHVVVAMRDVIPVGMLVLLEGDGMRMLANLDVRLERMRLRYLVDRLQVAVASNQREGLACTVGAVRSRPTNRATRPACMVSARRRKRGGTPSSNTWSSQQPAARLDTTRPIMTVVRDVGVTMAVAVAMPVIMTTATQKPGAHHVHGEAEAGDRDRLPEVDRNRREEAR